MTDFVLDNSVAMRWLFESNRAADQAYAENVLQSLTEHQAFVPNLWHLEAVDVLLASERRGDISAAESERFTSQLEALPIIVDPLTSHRAFGKTLALARAYRLSSYDAAYLDLALREGLPIATLDKAMLKAARKIETPIYSA